MSSILSARPTSRWAAPLFSLVLGLFGLAVLGGCGQSARDLSLDKAKARESLTAFLDSWKEGKKVDALQSRDPPITGRDSDWDNGGKLTAYTIGAEREDGTNSHFDVTLEIEGKPKQTATYVVGTSPVITVFRDE